jgi:CRP-like cAMP-binding protein
MRGILATMRGRTQMSDRLAAVPMFAACTRSDLKILARHVVEVEVPSGVALVKEGDRGDAFYVVISGTAAVVSGSGRSAKTVAELGPGASFGELAILDPAPRNATITASSDMVVGVLGARVFKAVLRDVPSLTEKLLAGMARRLREADKVVNDLAGAKLKGDVRKSRAGHAQPPRPQRRTARSSGSRTR